MMLGGMQEAEEEALRSAAWRTAAGFGAIHGGGIQSLRAKEKPAPAVTLQMETVTSFELKLGAAIYLKQQKFTRIFCCKNNCRCVIKFILTR